MMTRDQQGVVLFLGLLLTLLFLLPASPPPPAAAPAAGPLLLPEANGEIWVEIEGPVRSRGIYALARGKTAGEAVEKAGGLGGGVSLTREAGALRIEKSGVLNISEEGEKKGGAAFLSLAPPKMKVLSIPVNINAAPVEELDILPGVGPKTARAIVDFREASGKFSSLEDLAKVKGIGPKKLAALRPHITLGE